MNMFTNIIEVSTAYVDIEPHINRRVHETMIKKHLRRPFILGKNIILRTQTIFNVYKVENATYVYELNPISNNIKRSSKVSHEIINSERDQSFIATVDKTVIFPKVLKFNGKLFGFQNVENQLMHHINRKGNRCICLSSPKGYGKSTFLRHLEDKLDGKYFCTISHERMGSEDDYLMELLDSLEFVRDDIILCIPDFDAYDEHEQKEIGEMARSLQDNERVSIKVVLTTSDMGPCNLNIHVDYKINVPSLNDNEKAGLISYLMETSTELTDGASSNPPQELISGLRGYSATDIVNFVDHVSICRTPLTMDLLIECTRDPKYVPYQMRQFVSNEVRTSWIDIGGYRAVKTLLQDSIVKPLLSRQPLYSGVLFYGPPGCSKTMFARALATECNLKIFEVRPSTVMRSVVGETEAAVQQIMSRARAAAPSMIFVDEIETLLPSRAVSGGAHVSGRLLSEFLTFLDGVSRDRDKVLFVAATNYVDRLDQALVRAGRIDFKIEIGLPDEESRIAILTLELCRLEVAVAQSVWDSLNHIAQSLAGYSGSSIVDMCWQFQYKAMGEHESANMNDIVITIEHVIAVLGAAWTGLY